MGLFKSLKKVLKKAVKVAAFVAIATFAAPVAAGIGLSAVVGTVAGSALVGAAAGAATNAVLGGGIVKGALMGGLAGGVGGLAKVASTGTGILGDAYAVAPGAAEGAAVGAVPGAVANAAPGAVDAGLSAGEILVTGARPLAGLAAAAPIVAGAGAGLAAGTGAGSNMTGDITNMEPSSDPNAATGPGSNMTGDIMNIGPAPVAAGTTPLATAGTGASGGAIGATNAGGGLLSGIGGAALDVAKAVAPPLIASVIGGGGGGVAGEDTVTRQNEIIDDQKQALEEAQKRYADNFNLKTGYAQGLIDDANQYDPEVAGRRAAEAARIRAGLSARNAARGAGGRRAEVIQRQGEIEGGRNATSAYWNAYGTTGGARTQLRSAGINAIPLGNPPSGSDYASMYGSVTGQGNAQDAERDKKVSNIAGLITSGIGALTGDDRNEDEVARRAQG